MVGTGRHSLDQSEAHSWSRFSTVYSNGNPHPIFSVARGSCERDRNVLLPERRTPARALMFVSLFVCRLAFRTSVKERQRPVLSGTVYLNNPPSRM